MEQVLVQVSQQLILLLLFINVNFNDNFDVVFTV